MINVLESTNFRKKDDVTILIKTSKLFYNTTTHEIVSELPDGADATEWAELSGYLRKDGTDEVYEIVHDVEDAPYTYTEVFLTPESYCKISYLYATTAYVAHPDTNLYPTYYSTKTYAMGDRVTSDGMEWESDFDDNIGNPPKTWGWTLVLPYVEQRDLEWATLEELASA